MQQKPATTKVAEPKYTTTVVKKQDPLIELDQKLHDMEHRIADLESAEIIHDYFDVNTTG